MAKSWSEQQRSTQRRGLFLSSNGTWSTEKIDGNIINSSHFRIERQAQDNKGGRQHYKKYAMWAAFLSAKEFDI